MPDSIGLGKLLRVRLRGRGNFARNFNAIEFMQEDGPLRVQQHQAFEQVALELDVSAALAGVSGNNRPKLLMAVDAVLGCNDADFASAYEFAQPQPPLAAEVFTNAHHARPTHNLRK